MKLLLLPSLLLASVASAGCQSDRAEARESSRPAVNGDTEREPQPAPAPESEEKDRPVRIPLG